MVAHTTIVWKSHVAAHLHIKHWSLKNVWVLMFAYIDEARSDNWEIARVPVLGEIIKGSTCS